MIVFQELNTVACGRQWRRHRVDWGGPVPLIRSISIFVLARKPHLRKMLLEKVAFPKISKKDAKKY